MSTKFLPLVIAVLVPLYFGIVYYVVTRVTPISELLNGKSFHAVAIPQWGPNWTWFLLVFRIGGVLFFSMCAYGIQLMLAGSNQFTDWNVVLIMWYYMFGALCTAINCLVEYNTCLQEIAKNFVDKYGEGIGNILGIIFVVMASDALFITVVDFAILDRSLTFGNLAIHFFNSVFALCELSLNSISIQKSDVIFVIGWVYIFMVHAWIAVATGAGYPYEFLECGSPTAVLMYLALLTVCAAFFKVVWTISHCIKEGGSISLEHMSKRSTNEDAENSLSHSLMDSVDIEADKRMESVV